MLDYLREDYRRYLEAEEGRALGWLRAALKYGFIAVCVYRYGRWTRTLPRLVSLPFKLVYHLLNVPCELALGIRLSVSRSIGPGLYIGHHGGIIFGGDAGRNLSIAQGVTVGYKGAGKSTHPPRLGDDVYLGAGSMVIGDVHVGSGSIIGANTVVTRNVPPRTRVVSAAVRMTSLDEPAPIACTCTCAERPTPEQRDVRKVA